MAKTKKMDLQTHKGTDESQNGHL
ncbi:hypothetical protein AYI69_g5417, partial [Smittium culicis]